MWLLESEASLMMGTMRSKVLARSFIRLVIIGRLKFGKVLWTTSGILKVVKNQKLGHDALGIETGDIEIESKISRMDFCG